MSKPPRGMKKAEAENIDIFAKVMHEQGQTHITQECVVALQSYGVKGLQRNQKIDEIWASDFWKRHEAKITSVLEQLKEVSIMAELQGLAKELGDVKKLYPSKDELKGKGGEGQRKKAWDKLEKYYEELAKVSQKVRNQFFKDVDLEDMNFSTAKLRGKKQPAKKKYQEFQTQIKKPLEDAEAYDDVWAGLKLASIVQWRDQLPTKNKEKLTYRHLWELVQVSNKSMRQAIVGEFLGQWQDDKEATQSLAVLQVIIRKHKAEQTIATAMPKVDVDATLDYETVMAKLRQGELSVVTNHSMLAVASKALSDGKAQELGKRLAEIRDTELNAITKSINKLMVILEVDE